MQLSGRDQICVVDENGIVFNNSRTRENCVRQSQRMAHCFMQELFVFVIHTR